MQLAASLCPCGRPSSHAGRCGPRRALRRAGEGAPLRPKRRFTEHTPPGNPYVLAPDHPAVTGGRTLFLARRAASALQDRLLKGGENNRKIGGDVTKGRLRGAKVFTLTLEERATCPSTCTRWRDCYGNVMNWPQRLRADDDLMPLLEAELRKLHARHGLVLVRLHVLGDFFSVDYVLFWCRMLKLLPGLHLYGYTARNGCDIGAAIDTLNESPRCWIRFSDGQPEQLRAITVDKAEQALAAGAIVCPVQTGRTDCCGSCGLCWATPKTIAFLRH